LPFSTTFRLGAVACWAMLSTSRCHRGDVAMRTSMVERRAGGYAP
jgi:hypothetical protein